MVFFILRLILPLVKISCDDIFMVRFMLLLTEILYGSFFIVRLVIPLAKMWCDGAFHIAAYSPACGNAM